MVGAVGNKERLASILNPFQLDHVTWAKCSKLNLSGSPSGSASQRLLGAVWNRANLGEHKLCLPRVHQLPIVGIALLVSWIYFGQMF